MKNIFKYSLIATVFLAWSCEEVDNDFDIAGSSAGTYVEFTNATDTVEVAEDGAIDLIARISYAIPSNTTVSISVTSENAVYGTDYNISTDGFTADGGTLVIAYDPDSENLDRDTVSFDFPADLATDGAKYLTVEITSATADGAEFSLGGEAQRSVVVLAIADIDCESDLTGSYVATNCYPDPSQVSTWAEDPDQNARYGVTFITGGYYGYAGVPNIQGIVLEQCGNFITESPVVVSYADGSPAISITVTGGSVAADGSITLNWSDAGGFAGPLNCSTTFVPSN